MAAMRSWISTLCLPRGKTTVLKCILSSIRPGPRRYVLAFHRRQSSAANMASGTGGFILVTVGDQTVTATDSSVAWLAKSLAAVGQSEDCATDMFGQPRPGTHDAGQVGVAERGSRRRRGQGAV